MFVQVNGARLYVDIEGAGLVPDGSRMRSSRPLILLHGGPGFDHALYKPAFSALADIAQIVYFDHRGNGRSSGSDPKEWNLAQWGDDVKGLCDALGIERPIVYGAHSAASWRRPMRRAIPTIPPSSFSRAPPRRWISRSFSTRSSASAA